MQALVVGSLVFGAELALIALSFNLSYRIIRFANFAHVEFVTLGAFLAHTLAFNLPLAVAGLLATLLTGGIAVVLDVMIFRRLQHASVGSKMIVSAGLAIAMRALVQYFWGVNARTFDRTVELLPIFGIRMSLIQAVVIAVAVASVLLFHIILQHTSLGRGLRATADNPALVEIRGLQSNRIITQTWFISGALAGLAGVLIGVETFVQPALGLSVLLPMFAAAVVGGFGSPFGAIAGALLLSFGQSLVVTVDFGTLVGSDPRYLGSHYKSVFAFAALVLILLVRPAGFFGEKEARA